MNRINNEIEDQPDGSKKKKMLKKLGMGTIIFFTVKGIITTSAIIGAYFGIRGCW